MRRPGVRIPSRPPFLIPTSAAGPLKDANAVNRDLSYLLATGGFSFAGGKNNIETVVSTSTATPFTNVGLYCHCSTALTAESRRYGGPDTGRALLTEPFLPMIT